MFSFMSKCQAQLNFVRANKAAKVTRNHLSNHELAKKHNRFIRNDNTVSYHLNPNV